MVNVRQQGMLRERRDAEYQELHKTIEYMNAKQGALGHDGAKAKADDRSSGGSSGKEFSGCRGLAEGGVTQKAAAGSRSSKAEGDLLVSEVGLHQNDTEKDQKSFGHVKAPQKRRAVIRARLAETQDHVSAPPTDESHGAEH